jgi:cytochrome c biogenesis protein CcdA
MVRDKNRDKDKKKDRSGDRDRPGEKDRAKEEAAEAERKKKSDSFFYTLVTLLVIFVLCMRFGSALGSPWSEILIVVQIICPVVAGVLFFKTFPHPLRSMNRRLAEERRSIAREAKKKKRRGF